MLTAGTPRRWALTVADPRTDAPVATVVVEATDPGVVAVKSTENGSVSVFADGVCVTVTPGAVAGVGR